ncbi:MAG TPA: DNA cytosine methyltransferase, partial [Arthrobacter sp.]
GGLDLAAMHAYDAGLAWCADSDPHVTKILQARFPAVPNLGDLTAVDWSAVPQVDIVTAGFPCQDISYAGRNAGLRKDTRSGLWFTIANAVRLLQPGLLIVENVAALRSRGLDQVLGNLAILGYHTAWTCLRASDIGAPHRRERLFLLAAHPASARLPRCRQPGGQEGGWAPAELAGRGLCSPAADPGRVQPQRRGASAILADATCTAAAPPGDALGDRGQTAAHPARQRQRYGGPMAESGISAAAVGGTASHSQGLGRNQGLQESDRLARPPHAAGDRLPNWGPYESAIRRWETVLGRPAPDPTERGTRGQPRLAARFVEWMMGLPAGWVTDIDVSRTAQMRALGNGVVRQQAAHAIAHLDQLLFDASSQTGGLT